jgi:hypothetical protein
MIIEQLSEVKITDEAVEFIHKKANRFRQIVKLISKAEQIAEANNLKEIGTAELGGKMFENIKEQKGTLYRGSIPFMLINKNKKIIYISSSNKNINDYYFSIGDFSDIKKYRIENYNYSVEEFIGKNYELIQFRKRL